VGRREKRVTATAKGEMTKTDPKAIVLNKKEADSLRANLRGLRRQIEDSYVAFAKQLWKAINGVVGGDPLYQIWGYATFDDYAESELGMKRGKAYYLAQIWGELHVNAQIPESKIAEIDWSHAKELAPLAKSGGLTGKNVDDWVKKAKLQPVHQFAQEVKAAKAKHVSGTANPPETVHRITVGLYDEQHKNYERAIKAASELAESDKIGHLWDMICLEFNAQYAGKEKGDRPKAIKRYVAMMERVFGVRVIVIDPDTENVIVGKDMAKELMEGE
jgi:hypothetical protein